MISNENILENENIKQISAQRFFPAPFTQECYCQEINKSQCQTDLVNIKSCVESFKLIDLNMFISSPYYFNNPDLLNLTGIKPPINFTMKNFGTYLDVEKVKMFLIFTVSITFLFLDYRNGNSSF